MRIHAGLCLVLSLSGAAAAQTLRLTPDEAARRVLEVSEAAKAAAERTSAADAQVRSAESPGLPSVTLSAVATERSSVPEFRLPISVPGAEAPVLAPDITETWSLGARASQVLYAGGAIRAQRTAARGDRDVTAAQREVLGADLRREARTVFWEAVRAAASHATARVQGTRAEQVVSDTRALFEAGLSVKADVLAAEERAARAQVQVIRAAAAAANALAQLRSLLALSPTDPVELGADLGGSLPAPAGPVPGLLEQALAGRPERRVVSAQREAARAREGVAGSPARPSLLASAQAEVAQPNLRYFPQEDVAKGSWAVSLSASYTLFDGGKWRADVAATRALQRALEADARELDRRIQLEVEVAARDLSASLEAVAATEAAYAAATESEKAALERREAGLAPILDVLDAQAQLARAEDERIQTRAAAWIAAARLDRALGR